MMSDAEIICEYLKENGFISHIYGDRVFVTATNFPSYSIQIWPGKCVECYSTQPCKKKFNLPRLESPNYIEELKEFVAILNEHWRQYFADVDNQTNYPIPVSRTHE